MSQLALQHVLFLAQFAHPRAKAWAWQVWRAHLVFYYSRFPGRASSDSLLTVTIVGAVSITAPILTLWSVRDGGTKAYQQ